MALKSAGVKLPQNTDYSSHLSSKPIQAMVSTEKKVAGEQWGGTPATTEDVVPGLFDTNGMSVSIEASRTLNLGNYESAKIGIVLIIPCSPSSLNDAYQWGLNWASERISEEVSKATGS